MERKGGEDEEGDRWVPQEDLQEVGHVRAEVQHHAGGRAGCTRKASCYSVAEDIRMKSKSYYLTQIEN